jgi:aminopeptidase N
MGSSWRRRAAGAVAGVAAAALIAGPGVAQAQGGPEACTAGAPGIGDAYYPTYGNGGYDVGHYDLNVAYDPATDQAADHLEGRARIRATATQSLCSFNLDLVGLNVKGIEVDDEAATWTRSGQELVVTPQDPLADGVRFDVVVRYAGEPTEFLIPGTTLRTGFMDTPEGATVAGQPEVAAGWFPVNDHPLDKASYSFNVTVPEPYEVAANGFLRGTRDLGNRTRWQWDANEPMASYLATIDIAKDWDVNTQPFEDAPPRYDAVSPRISADVRAEIDSSLARQGEILGVLEDSFGPYPFDTVGAIVPNQDDLRFALETQTRPVYSKLFWGRPGNARNGDGVVVHELAHQWYGDDVALARWQDIWLNEGFASYAEWLWAEYEDQGTTQQTFEATYDSIPATDPFWSVTIGDPGVEDLFSDPVYVRGAMTLQALRNEVGDGSFFAILKQWAATKSGGNGTTPEFIDLAEEISGQDLGALFNTWLFTGTKPDESSVTPGATAAGRATTRSASGFAERWQRQVHRRLKIGMY